MKTARQHNAQQGVGESEHISSAPPMTRQQISEAIALEAQEVPFTMPFFLAAELLSECRRQGLKESDYTGSDYSVRVRIGEVANGIEPRSGLRTGIWFDGELSDAVWGYRGTLSAVIQFAKPSPEYATEPYVVSRCPPCERHFLMGKWPSRKVKRWMILPL